MKQRQSRGSRRNRRKGGKSGRMILGAFVLLFFGLLIAALSSGGKSNPKSAEALPPANSQPVTTSVKVSNLTQMLVSQLELSTKATLLGELTSNDGDHPLLRHLSDTEKDQLRTALEQDAY